MAQLSAELANRVLATTMDSMLLDLERARMEREDFRQGNAPGPPAWSKRTTDRSWRWWFGAKHDEFNRAQLTLFHIRDVVDMSDGIAPEVEEAIKTRIDSFLMPWKYGPDARDEDEDSYANDEDEDSE